MAKLKIATHRKSDLDKIPEAERALYLMGGQLANDINILGKLLIFAHFTPTPDKPRQWAGMTTLLLILKVLAGRLYEGNLLIRQTFSARKLRDEYRADLGPDALGLLDKLNRYFGAENAIEKVRNKFAFHFDVQEIERSYAQIPPDFKFVDVVSDEYRGDNLFYGSEVISFHALTEVMQESEPALAIDRLMKETIEIADNMGRFLGCCFELMWRRYLSFTKENVQNLEIQSDAPVNSHKLPFFCEPPVRERRNI